MYSYKFKIPKLITGMLVITTLFTNCRKVKDNNCVSYEQAPVLKVEGDKNGKVNQEMAVQVYFGCHNGCGHFGSFEERVSGNTRTVIVNARYEGCACTMYAPTRIENYKFTPSQPGIYYLRFQKAENNYLIDTLTVQP